MAINQFVDLTKEEFQSMYLGKSTFVKIDNIELSSRNNLGEVDWSRKMFPIKDQGNCGSFWAFSAIGLKWELAEQQLVDCAYYAGDGCYGGDAALASDYIAEVGSVYEMDYEYKSRSGICKVRREGEVKISGRVSYVPNEDSIKKGIQNYPLSVSVDATDWSFYSKGIFDGNCKENYNNHATVAVGFDNAGNWKIRNSWGEGWGDQGYIWLRPGNSCGVMTRVDGAI